nr:hypothetical protein [Tanacetum cinerariifolium]
MESLSPQVVSTAKLPILNPNEFDLRKMRIEQYFLMTDYYFGRSLPTEWRTHTLIWRNKTDLKEQSLDDLFNNLKIYEVEVKSSSSASTTTQNIAFVSSQTTDNTNDPVSAVASVSAASVKILVSSLPNVDTLSNAQIDVDDLEEMDLKRQIAMLTVRARECRSPKDTRRNGAPEPQRRNVPVKTSTSNALVLECDGLESVEARLLVYQQNEYVFEEDIKLLKLEVQLRDNALVILRQKFEKAEQERDDLKLKFENSMYDCDEMFTSETDDSLPASPIYDRYHLGDEYHAVPPPYTGTFMPPKPDLVFHDSPNVNETIHTAFNVELSPTKPYKDLSHTHRPSAPIIEDWVSDLEDDSEDEITQNVPSFVQPTEQVTPPRPFVKTFETTILAANHKTAIRKPKSKGNHRNRKACFVCKSLDHLIKDCDFYEKTMAQTPTRNNAQRGNHQQYARMTLTNPQKHVVPTVVLTKSKLVLITAARPVTAAVPNPHVTRPKQAKTIITKPHSPPKRNINRSPSLKASTFSPKVTAAKAPMVNVVKGNWGNPQHALKDKGVIDSGCSRYMIGNMSYLSDFKELNGRYVAFGGNPKADSLLPIPFWAEAVNTACYVQNRVLVTKPQNKTPYELLLGRSPSIGFMRLFGYLVTILNTLDPLGSGPTWLFDIGTLKKTMNYQPVTAGNQSNLSAGVQDLFDAEKAGEESAQQYVLFPVWSFGSTNPQNTDDDATIGGKKPEFEGRKPEYEVYVSLSSSAQTKKHDDKTKKETKGKSPVDAAGPSNTAVSPTHGKSSYVNTSQYPDDPNMPELEDITYSDDEEDVGAEADFTNLETTITVSPILTTRFHKDHHVTQIIGDLTSATQTRSMTRVAKDQGFEDPDHPDKVYKVVKALYGLHQAPRACSTNKDLCKDFEKLLKDEFQMSSMGKLTFFLGIQVKQKQDGIFISQDKYVADILRKFGLTDGKSASTSIDTKKPLLMDPDGEDVDVHTYRLMIGSLMYLTSSRPDIMFTVYACTCFQVTPKASHLHAVKRIFRYLKVNDVTRLQALVDKKKVIITEATIRDALRLDDAESIDFLPNEEIFTELSRIGYEKPSTKLTFYKAFFSPQWKFLIHTILQCMSAKRTSWNEFSSSMASAVICLSTVGNLSSHTIKYSSPALTQKVFANVRRVGKGFSRVDTPLFEGMIVAQQADEGAAEVNVDDVPAAGVADEGAADVPFTSQVQPTPLPSLTITSTTTTIFTALEITKLQQRVKKLEMRNKLKVSKLRRLKKVVTAQRVDTSDDTVMDDVSKQRRIIASMDADVDVTLKDVAKIAKEVAVDAEIEEKPAELQEVVEVVTTAKLMTEVVTAASVTITAATTPMTAAVLTTAPSAARRRNGVVIRDSEETATPSTIIHSEAKSKDKGKGILVEEPKPLKKQAQIKQDEAFARELEAELNKTIN